MRGLLGYADVTERAEQCRWDWKREELLKFSLKLILSTGAVLISMNAVSVAQGAEFRMTPSLLLSEEYNDNVFLEERDQVSEYITRVLPSLGVTYRSPLWDWNVLYAYDYRYYAHRSVENDESHIVDAQMLMELLRDRLYVDASDDYRRVSLDATRDFSQESPFLNQSDRNAARINPYIVFGRGSRVEMTAGYVYSRTWFEEETGTNAEDNIAHAEIEYEMRPDLFIETGYRYTDERSDALDFRKNDVHVGARRAYGDRSSMHFRVGHSEVEFENGRGDSHEFWSAGVSHRFPRFTASVESSREYSENPSGDPLKITSHRIFFNAPMEPERAGGNTDFHFSEYRNSVTGESESKQYGFGGAVEYRMSQRALGRLDFSADVFEEESPDAYTIRYLAGLRMRYSLSRSLEVAVEDRYAYAYSPDLSDNNYKNNRVTVEVRKDF